MNNPPPFVDITIRQINISCNQPAQLDVVVTAYNAGKVIVCLNLVAGIPCFFTGNGSQSNSFCQSANFTEGESKTLNFNFNITCINPDTYWTNIEAVATDSAGLHGTDTVRTQIQCA